VPFSVTLDNGRYELVGTSKTDPSNGLSVILTPGTEEGKEYLEAFASSETMIINFENGDEPRWNVKMAGSRDATKVFRTCVKGLGEEDKPQATTSPCLKRRRRLCVTFRTHRRSQHQRRLPMQT